MFFLHHCNTSTSNMVQPEAGRLLLWGNSKTDCDCKTSHDNGLSLSHIDCRKQSPLRYHLEVDGMEARECISQQRGHHESVVEDRELRPPIHVSILPYLSSIDPPMPMVSFHRLNQTRTSDVPLLPKAHETLPTVAVVMPIVDSNLLRGRTPCRNEA